MPNSLAVAGPLYGNQRHTGVMAGAGAQVLFRECGRLLVMAWLTADCWILPHKWHGAADPPFFCLGASRTVRRLCDSSRKRAHKTRTAPPLDARADRTGCGLHCRRHFSSHRNVYSPCLHRLLPPLAAAYPTVWILSTFSVGPRVIQFSSAIPLRYKAALSWAATRVAL
jgi:hypothetical protein